MIPFPFQAGQLGRRRAGSSLLTYPQQVALDGPVRYWRLNDISGTTAVGTGGNGTYANSVNLNQAAFVNGGKSVQLNSAVDTLNGHGYLETNFGTAYTSQHAVEIWFNAASTQNDGSPALFGKNSYFASSATDFPIVAYWNGSLGRVVVLLSQGNDFTADATIFADSLAADTDYHLVWNYRANGLCEIYINGALAASQTIGFTISAGSRNWRFGAQTEVSGGGAGDTGFQGRIGEVAIYSAALSASRIAAHYAARNN